MDDYWGSVEHFCELCRRDFPREFVSLVVVGSLSVGDIVPGWSDVDAYLVLRSVTGASRRTASALAAKVALRFPFLSSDRGPLFCVEVVSRREALEGGGEVSSLSQWDMKRHGIVACGEDFLADLPEPDLDREWLNGHLDWMAAFLEREADAPAYWKGRNAVGFLLSGARAVLLKEGAYAKRKGEIAAEFSRRHPGEAAIVERALETRAHWADVQANDAVLEALYGEAGRFLRWARAQP